MYNYVAYNRFYKRRFLHLYVYVDWIHDALFCPDARAGVSSTADSFLWLLGLYVLQLTGTLCNPRSAHHNSLVIA